MALTAFSTCELSDALSKLGFPHGGHLPDILPLDSTTNLRIGGPAYTVQMVFQSDPSAPKLSAHFVDTAPAGSIIVIHAPEDATNAVWGGLMSAGAQARSALGVVIAGRCRDVSELKGLKFPVFSRGRSTMGQGALTRASAVNATLRIGPTEVNPSDWIVADEDGVVCIPKDLVDAVLESAGRGREVDSQCMEAIKAGRSIQETFKEYRGK